MMAAGIIYHYDNTPPGENGPWRDDVKIYVFKDDNLHILSKGPGDGKYVPVGTSAQYVALNKNGPVNCDWRIGDPDDTGTLLHGEEYYYNYLTDRATVTLDAGDTPCNELDGVSIYAKIAYSGMMPYDETWDPTQEAFGFTTIYDVNLIAQSLDLDSATGHHRDLRVGGLPWSEEEDPGAYIHINCDDDNEDGDRDLEDWAVTLENDLLELTPAVTPLPNEGTVTLARSSGAIIVWSDDEKGFDNKVLQGTYNATTEDNGIKTWDLSNSTQRAAFQNFMNNHLYVEGINPNEVSLTLTYHPPGSSPTCSDLINYKPFGATSGSLTGKLFRIVEDPPPPHLEEYTPTSAQMRDFIYSQFPDIVECEWSVLGDCSETYNCIGWSVGDDSWYNSWNIEWNWTDRWDYADHLPKLDSFYYDEWPDPPIHRHHLQYDLLPGPDIPETDVVYYSGYHACRRTSCPGMQLAEDDYPISFRMFSSKLGNQVKIAHVWDQLTSPGYGSPVRYYRQR